LLGCAIVDRMLDVDLSPFIRSLLADKHASRTALRAEMSNFGSWLEKRGYPAHASVLAFEAAYGGIQLFESDPQAPALLVGPYAILQDGAYKGRERDLVPVMFAWDDVVYSLDAEGRGYTCAAMVEGVSRLAARDGKQLVSQAILWRNLVNLHGNFSDLEGAHGAMQAATLGLPLLVEASSDVERWWSNGHQFVVEILRGNGYTDPRTYVVE
jgi:hypothetical protein